MKKEDLKGKKIAVLGVGIEGASLVEFLKNEGADVTILDQREEAIMEKEEHYKILNLNVPVFFGKNVFERFSEFEVIFRSPGIKKEQKELSDAERKGIIVTSQTQLFFDLCPCPIIGVTGTKGKGTTSSLIYEMLKAEGRDAYLGGNIGIPPLSFLNLLTPDSRVVLEMSSFQLQDLKSSPHIAVMLMTVPEHMDYHKDMEEYIDAKRNILRFQKPDDFAILNKDYPSTRESDLFTDAKVFHVSRENETDEGCFVKDGTVLLRLRGKEQKIIDASEILLPGKHNHENVCAAVVAATLAGVEKANVVKVLKTFKGLEHRLEPVRVVKGVTYYDDSFSTTPETAIAAIEAFENSKILILGGSSKNSDFTELGKVISESKSIKAIIGIGQEWERIKDAIGSNLEIKMIEGCKNMEEIVKKASNVATIGDVVLLSPACASFGMFKNYKDRGNQFKEEVNNLVQ